MQDFGYKTHFVSFGERFVVEDAEVSIVTQDFRYKTHFVIFGERFVVAEAEASNVTRDFRYSVSFARVFSLFATVMA
jgi:hypothetical protein